MRSLNGADRFERCPSIGREGGKEGRERGGREGGRKAGRKEARKEGRKDGGRKRRMTLIIKSSKIGNIAPEGENITCRKKRACHMHSSVLDKMERSQG